MLFSIYRSTKANKDHTPNFVVVPAELKIGGAIATELALEFADNMPVVATYVLALLVVIYTKGSSHALIVRVCATPMPAKAL